MTNHVARCVMIAVALPLTVFDKWRMESPRDPALLKQVETEVARVRAGE
jgi:hypothetical protein